MCSCCFFKLLCYELLLGFRTSLFCIHVTLWWLLIVSSCSSVAPCCALLVLFNASLLCTLATFSHLIMCYYYFIVPPYCVLLVYFHASLLCIPNVIQCLVVCSWCSLALSCSSSPPCYSFMLFFGTSLLCILVVFWFLFNWYFPIFFYVGVEDEVFVTFPSTTNLKGVFFLSQCFILFYFFFVCSTIVFFLSIFFDKKGFHFILFKYIYIIGHSFYLCFVILIFN